MSLITSDLTYFYLLEWLTVTVPSEVIGLWEAHKKYGKLEWHYLVDPAIGFASHGFPIGTNLAKYLAIYNRTVKRSPQLRYVLKFLLLTVSVKIPPHSWITTERCRVAFQYFTFFFLSAFIFFKPSSRYTFVV